VRDVRVYLDNREVGRTDADGALLLPTLLPYQANRLRVEVEDLPLDTILETDQLEAVPYERSGVAVTFPVRRLQQASAQLRLADGTPLPPAAELGAEGVWVRVGRGGFAVIDGARPEPVTVRGTVDGIDYVCVLPAAPAGELQPDLGTVRCGS
jgi:outer membrane usher protein